MQHKDKKILQLNKALGLIIKDIRIKKTGLSCSKLANEYGLDRGNLNRMKTVLLIVKFLLFGKHQKHSG